MSRKDPSPVMCCECEKESAINRCLDCPAQFCSLCHDCSFFHSRSKSMKDHKIVPLDDSMDGTHWGLSSEMETPTRCTKHPGQLLTVFCEDCEQLICDKCCNLLHFSHNVLHIEGGIGRLHSEVMTSMASCWSKVHEGNNAILRLKQEVEGLDKLFEQIKLSIHFDFNELEQHLKIRQDKIMNDLENHPPSQRLQQSINSKIMTLETQLKSMNNTLENTKNIQLYENLEIERPLQVFKYHIQNVNDNICQTKLDYKVHFQPISLQYIRNTKITTDCVHMITSLGRIFDCNAPVPSRSILYEERSEFRNGTFEITYKLIMNNVHGQRTLEQHPKFEFNILQDLGREVVPEDPEELNIETVTIPNYDGSYTLLAVLHTFAEFSVHVTFFQEHVSGSPAPVRLVLGSSKLLFGEGRGRIISVSSILKLAGDDGDDDDGSVQERHIGNTRSDRDFGPLGELLCECKPVLPCEDGSGISRSKGFSPENLRVLSTRTKWVTDIDHSTSTSNGSSLLYGSPNIFRQHQIQQQVKYGRVEFVTIGLDSDRCIIEYIDMVLSVNMCSGFRLLVRRKIIPSSRSNHTSTSRSDVWTDENLGDESVTMTDGIESVHFADVYLSKHGRLVSQTSRHGKTNQLLGRGSGGGAGHVRFSSEVNDNSNNNSMVKYGFKKQQQRHGNGSSSGLTHDSNNNNNTNNNTNNNNDDEDDDENAQKLNTIDPWVPLREASEWTPPPPDLEKGVLEYKRRVRLSTEERVFLGPVDALRLEVRNAPGKSVEVFGLNVFGLKLT